MNRGRAVTGGMALALAGAVAVFAGWEPDARAEAIPLIKAEPGPIKVKPQNPGGLVVPHKDKSIYQRIEANRKVVPAGDPKKAHQTASATKPGQRNIAQALGPYRIQLGSFTSSEHAQRRWQEIKSRHGDLVGGLTMVLERVELRGKGTMVRLQAGPLKTADEVKKLCAALAKRKVGCFLVKS